MDQRTEGPSKDLGLQVGLAVGDRKNGHQRLSRHTRTKLIEAFFFFSSPLFSNHTSFNL